MTAYTYPGIEPRHPDVIRVANFTGLTYEAITGTGRHKEVSAARQACMYILVNIRNETLHKAGEIINRRYCTTYQGCQAFSNDLKYGAKRVKELRKLIETIQKEADATATRTV